MLSIVIFLLFISIFCNVLQIYFNKVDQWSSLSSSIRETVETSSTATQRRNLKTRLTKTPNGTINNGSNDKSRKIFFDFGANNGQSTKFFLDPVSTASAAGQAEQGGTSDSILRGMGSSGDWDVVVVEANVNHTIALDRLKEHYLAQNKVKSFSVFGGTAIAKTSGPVTFILDNGVSGAEGATTMPESTSAVGPHVQIAGLGIIDLFHQLYVHHSDFVVVKADIEGYEFELMRHIIVHGLHSRIDIMAVEYHDNNYFVFGKDEETRVKYEKLHSCITWMTEEISSFKQVDWG
jgi:hypothetical protein